MLVSRLLDYSLLFYEAQRSGKLPADQRITWRNDSALNDGQDVGVDLSGGYYDAGDYMKFIFPLTFSLTQVCWGGIEFFEGYKLANETKYLDQMVRWGMDWLIKAHPNNDTLYVQIGTDQVDNNYWGPDTTIPLPRATFQVSRSKPGTDVMADAAAAFASCSMLYRDKLNDTAYATTLQTHANSLFSLAETATPQQVYQTVVPAVTCCYASSGFVDELAWGAAWMYTLTNDTSYMTKAGTYVDQVNSGGVQTGSVTWDNKLGAVYILMASSTQGTSVNSKWQDLATQYADFTSSASKPCQYTKGGLYYCSGDSKDDSAVIAANAALSMHLMANQLDKMGGAQDKSDSYRMFALNQINYLLGDNPEKTPYIVGVHPNSPINPHSAPASGGVSVDNIDSDPVKELRTIYGALVGGPDKNDRFEDVRSNWRQSEVALDYNAPMTALMAYQVMTSKESPPYVVIPAGRPDLPAILNGMEIWQIILIVIGSIFVAIGICAVFCYRKRDHIRAWAAARKNRKNGGPKYQLTVNRDSRRDLNKEGELEHGMRLPSEEQELGQYDHTRDDGVVHSLAVPPPPPLRANQEFALDNSAMRRPVPPPPLPARHDEDPILLQNAYRS
ncbi:MAG: Six-hairpin glycosidase-like protein [Podila humilis]|nr:MAG: Six-hairpin glycosidase-like protein [Podila humilis]